MKPCTIDGCGKPAFCRRWCEMHYRRWLRTGTTELRPPSEQAPEIEHGTHRGSTLCYEREEGICPTCRQFLTAYQRARRARIRARQSEGRQERGQAA